MLCHKALHKYWGEGFKKATFKVREIYTFLYKNLGYKNHKAQIVQNLSKCVCANFLRFIKKNAPTNAYSME